jgi:hypothetical protein
MKRRPFSVLGLRMRPPPGTPIGIDGGSYGAIVRRGEVAYLFCDHCIPPYRIDSVLFHEPPWNRYLNYPSSWNFRCPGCGHTLSMQLHNRIGDPFTERFGEQRYGD